MSGTSPTQFTDDALRELRQQAEARGDAVVARLAHEMLWARQFCDRARDATVAIAREVRRVSALPSLSLSQS